MEISMHNGLHMRGVRSVWIALAQVACTGPNEMSSAVTAQAGITATDLANALPIVFVHGGAGSATQYASVAKRFVSNGYPEDRIRTYEYNSSSGAAIAAAPAEIDAMIDAIRAEYGVDRVNLVGHSLGTTVSTAYLADPARAAKIAHYVGVDGRSGPTCGVDDPNLDCMGIFRGSVGDVGGNNIYLNDTQTHVEAATSPESFAAQFRFFTGDDPRTTLILPEPPGQVQVAGRAVYFPQNSGGDGALLRIWEVDGATGARKYAEPLATLDIGPSGNFGPVNVNGQQHYEFELTRPNNAIVQHIYYQPFIRDDYWVRLLSSLPTSGITLNTVIGPNHAAAVVTRNKEWWTVHPGGGMDVLDISTASRGRGDQPPANALENVISGAIGSVGTSAIGIHAHDNPADGVSSLAVIPFFATQAFQTGVDVYMGRVQAGQAQPPRRPVGRLACRRMSPSARRRRSGRVLRRGRRVAFPRATYGHDMQPFAFGRFAIDLPAAARLRGRSHTIAHLSVAAAEQHDGETPRSLLEAKVAERSPARIHRAHLHGPEMVSVVHHDDPDTPDSVFMEALRIAGGSVFKVSGANVIDKVDALEQAALQIGMAIVPTLDADPAVPGFCVERGVVAMGFFWEESATAVFDCDGTTLVLGSHSNADALPRSLLAKHAAAAPQLGAHGVSTVRSGRRTLFELSGEEIVLRSPSSAMVKWECVGKPRSADHPALSIQLEMKDGADLATVLAMWGELAASFRRRTR